MAWSVLQSWFADTGLPSSTASAAPSSNLTSGSKIIAVTGNDSASIVNVTITDGGSGTFSQIDHYDWSLTGRGDYTDIQVLDTPAGDAGTKPTFTATWGSAVFSTVQFVEVSGLATGQTSAILDGSAGHTAGGNTGVSSPFGPPTYSSSASNEFLLYAVGDFSDGITTWSGPSGYTTLSNDANGGNNGSTMIAYKNSTGGSETGQWSWTGGATYHGSLTLVAFKLPAAGGAFIAPAPKVIGQATARATVW